MRILYLFRSLAVWGGIERILVDKMNWLVVNGGIEVYMFTTDQGSHLIPYCLNEKVYIKDLNINFHRQYQYCIFKRLVIALQMRQKYKKLLSRHISRIQPDVIICTTADYLDIITKCKGDVPLVVESHSICNRTLVHGKNFILRKCHRYFFLKSLLKSDCVVSLTEGDAVEWRKYHNNVQVIPDMLHPCNSRRSSLMSKRVIWVGRFDYQKQAELAIRIWEQVICEHPDWYLDIYGEGEMEYEIISLDSSVKNVSVHKPTAQIFDCYCDSSVLISTSLFEPFGLVIIEAMSCGLPVVAFDCHYGPADIITNGENGFLVPINNMHFFAEKMCMLMKDCMLREKMGQAAFLSSKRYNSDFIMLKWKALFDELTKK